MAKVKNTPAEPHVEVQDVTRTEVAKHSSRLGWFLPRLGVMLALLGVVAWFAPTIVATTGLWKSVVGYAAPQWQGQIDAQRVSLGWFSPVVVEQAVLRDKQSGELLQVSRITSEKTLLGLIQSSTDLGKFTLTGPNGTVVVRADGSNVEDFLASLPQSGGAMPQFALELADGQITVVDEVAQRQWQLTAVRASVNWPAAGERKGLLSAAVQEEGTVQGSEAPPGEFNAEFTSTTDDFSSGSLQATVRGFPTASFVPLLRRLGFDAQPAGGLHADIAARWSDYGRQSEVQIHSLRAPQWSLVAPTWLANDRLQLALESGQGVITIANDRLTFRDLQLESDLMQVRGQGSASLASASGTPDDLELRGRIDLARLAQQLPSTLRLRPDTRITSGQLVWAVESRSDGGHHRLQGTLAAENLAAESGGRRVDWQQGVAVSAAVVHSVNGWQIEQLQSTARFLELSGNGTLDEGVITASANLNQLVADLSQVVDWQGLQLAGKLAGEIRWKRQPDNQWLATADASVQNFQLYAPGMMPWREDDLRIGGTVQGRASGTTLEQLSSGQFAVVSGQDRLDAELAAPVDDFSFKTAWPLRYVVQGDLATWLPRVQALFPTATIRPEGAFQLQGSGKFSPQRIEMDGAKLDVRNLRIEMSGADIREPELHLETKGVVDLTERKFTSPATTLAGTALALRADNVSVSYGEHLVLSGIVDYRGDLQRISAWFGPAGSQRTWELGGALTGTLEAKYQEGIVQAAWRTNVENLSYASVGAPPQRSPLASASASSPSSLQTRWVEPRVSFTGRGQYDPRQDSLQLAGTEFVSSALSVAASGTASEVRSRLVTDLQGEIRYDGASIAEKLRPILGDTLQISGQEQRKFSLKGPLLPGYAVHGSPAGLVSSELTGQASLGWQELKYVGVTAGKTEFPARLERGIASVGPVQLLLGDGKVNAAPRLMLNEPNLPLVLDKGPLVEQVRLSPEICHTWLKFVAPLLADVTRAEGKFSVDLAGAVVPLTLPEKTSVAGSMTIHHAEVGPGPLAQQYLALARQIRMLVDQRADTSPLIDPNKGLLVLPEQKVDFEVVEGRVHHQGMKMTVKDIVITTRGSVGMDQTVDLIADVPVQESWIKEGSPLVALRGKTISVPIRGNLANPQLDAKVVEQIGRDLFRNAAQEVIGDQINKGLQRLFGPQSPPR